MKFTTIKAWLLSAMVAFAGSTYAQNASSIASVPVKQQKPVTRMDSVSAAKLKVLQAKANGINEELKKQTAKLNKVYRDVSVETEEMLNNREDSIYLSILSRKRNVELEIAEVKKAAKYTVIQPNNSTTTQNTTATAQPVRPQKPRIPFKVRNRKPSKK